VLPTTSNDERLVDLSWAPDGQHLLLVSREPRTGGGLRTHLRWLDSVTGEASELASLPSEIVPATFNWRPDGHWVAFLARADQATSLCLLGTRSGEFRYLADLGRDDSAPLPFAPLAWAPDGERVVYSAPPQDRSGPPGWLFRGSPPLTLYLADLNGATSRRLTDAPGQSPTWRRDGSIVALDRPKWDGEILLRAVDPTGDARELGPLPVEAAPTYAVRWDVAHAQAIVAVRRAGTVGASGPSYWLVRFHAEADR
jgi:Tol biopolymer transport system component